MSSPENPIERFSLRLRPLQISDEEQFLRAHSIMAAEHWEFGLFFSQSASFADFIAVNEAKRRGEGLLEGRVPSTFLVAEVNGEIVGRSSIRHELNEWLHSYGGHIGYGVLPQFRRRGYAREILRQSLIIVRSYGVDRVLVTCDEDNIASRRTIEANGGVFDSHTHLEGDAMPTRRYWID
jgi:predicted acetyltransferase